MREAKETAQAVPGNEWNEERRQAVRDELKRMLAHPTFHSSVRCSELLGYVVRRSLAGESEEIKERTIGVDVFERDASYDIGSDPVVRRIANEVRKRIAQYYQDDPDGHAVIIHLPRGRYVPEFQFRPSCDIASVADAATPGHASSALLPRAVGFRHFVLRGKSRVRLLVLSAFLLLAAASSILVGILIYHSPVNRIWKPLVNSKASIMICLPDHDFLHAPLPMPDKGPQSAPTPGDRTGMAPDPGQQPASAARYGAIPNQSPSIMFGDVAVGYSISDLLGRLGKHYEMRSASEFKYSDARRGPVVLIGFIGENWLPTLLANARYSLRYDMATGDGWIQDAKDPSSRQWKCKAPPERWHETKDYALITRVFNEEIGQWVIALGGVSGRGTQAAARLLTDPQFTQKVRGYIRDTGNFQIVLRTAVISEEPGPIEIVAVYTW